MLGRFTTVTMHTHALKPSAKNEMESIFDAKKDHPVLIKALLISIQLRQPPSEQHILSLNCIPSKTLLNPTIMYYQNPHTCIAPSFASKFGWWVYEVLVISGLKGQERPCGSQVYLIDDYFQRTSVQSRGSCTSSLLPLWKTLIFSALMVRSQCSTY